jgi:hypothetical protein
MAEKNRIRNLSTRWLTPFKVVVFGVYVSLSIAIVYMFITRGEGLRSILLGLFNAACYCYFFFLLIRVTSKLYQIEFDVDFLYVLMKEQDLIIPLENIESVEISTLGGVYKVNLFHPEQLGQHFYFKLSMWYPLNYQSKDELVNVLRRNIDRAKSRKQDIPRNALHS